MRRIITESVKNKIVVSGLCQHIVSYVEETLVTTYKTTRCHNPIDHELRLSFHKPNTQWHHIKYMYFTFGTTHIQRSKRMVT
jgi:hypothetical protein